MNDVRRIIKAGWTSATRNMTVSLSSILTMMVTLVVLLIVFLFASLISLALVELEQKVDITVYFTQGARDTEIMEVRGYVESLSQVAATIYVSADQALEEFKLRHSGDPLTLQALDEVGVNPLTATLEIQATEPSQYPDIIELLETNASLTAGARSAIQKVDYVDNQEVIDRLSGLKSGIYTTGTFLMILLGGLSVLITMNTIRLAIFISREEIAVMRLVGANRRYAAGPFVVQGAIYGVFAALLAVLVFYGITTWLGNRVTDFIGVDIHTYFLNNTVQLLVLSLLVGVFLGVFSSVLSVRKYLRT